MDKYGGICTSKTTLCTDLPVLFGKFSGLASTRYIKVKCILCLRKIKSFMVFDEHFNNFIPFCKRCKNKQTPELL